MLSVSNYMCDEAMAKPILDVRLRDLGVYTYTSVQLYEWRCSPLVGVYRTFHGCVRGVSVVLRFEVMMSTFSITAIVPPRSYCTSSVFPRTLKYVLHTQTQLQCTAPQSPSWRLFFRRCQQRFVGWWRTIVGWLHLAQRVRAFWFDQRFGVLLP